MPRSPLLTVLSVISAWAASAILASAVAREPSFSRDVRPVLAANCFQCHGPDDEARQADLRLDTIEGATADLGGRRAVTPGRPAASELIRRITSADDDERMPPPESGKTPLTPGEIDTLRWWIASGAAWERHWAFVPPRRPPVPATHERDWPRSPIDAFILAAHEGEGLAPSAEAGRMQLVRRVYLDLIGLPPTPDEADDFVADQRPDAYERLVDRLLASPRYGERWARLWLDLARYADTNGYEKDRPRSIWPYRDWVIRAINANMPYDRFSIEQLAGDMLPAPSVEQLIATGFHRNTMLNEEGGIDPLEYRFHAMVDRVATTGTVWLGLTTGCAQCHTHKYDPITQTDYYRLMALLDNADEPDLIVRDEEVAARRRRIEARIARLEEALPDRFPTPDAGEAEGATRRELFEAALSAWIEAERGRVVPWTVIRPRRMETNLPALEQLDDGSILSTGDVTKRDIYHLHFELDDAPGPVAAIRLEALPDERLPAGGPGRAYYEGRKGDFFLSEVRVRRDGQPVALASASHSYGKISIGSGNADAGNVLDGDGSTGWSTAGREGEAHQLVVNLAEPLPAAGELEIELLFERHFAASLGRFRLSVTSSPSARASELPVELEKLLAENPASLSESARSRLRRHFLRVSPELADARKEIDALRRKLPDWPTTLIMQERPPGNPRATHRRHRGEYLQPREEVTPGIPAFLGELPGGAPANRLTFARWLVSDDNPLVGRVTANRAWRAFFGRGILRTSGDFGTQSGTPSHPELLDWLARELVDGRWSLKRLHRQIVTSATYRQDSRVTTQLLERDPENRQLARAPRFRIDAEVVRDALLAASGMLSAHVGGPGVRPPQPGIVTALAYGNPSWRASKGESRYRRSIYTFAKRTAPFAAYLVFDGPSGELCTARRDRSNTPLQALTLLNDGMFLELARALARAAIERERSAPERATFIFRRCLTRPPDPVELEALLEFRAAQLARLERGELDVKAVCGGENGSSPELAAWVMIARTIFNLDETITRP